MRRRVDELDLGDFKFVWEISNEYARTGQIIEYCRGCKHALIVEGENVENGGILFCTKFFDFPVKRLRVLVLPDKMRFSYTEKRYCIKK